MMKPEEVGVLHNSVLRLWMPQLREGASLRFVYRQIAELALQRGWTTPGRVPDMLSWLRAVVHETRSESFVQRQNLKDATKAHLEDLLWLARNVELSEGGAARFATEVNKIPRPQVGERESYCLDIARSVLTHSAELWEEEMRARPGAKLGSSGLDGGEIVEKDATGAVGGFIAGATGAAIASWYTTVGVAGAAAAGGVIGALISGAISSGIEYLEQDAARDTLSEDGGTNPTGPGHVD